LYDGEAEAVPVPLLRYGVTDRVSKVQLFFDLHGGEIWGLLGRLLYDLGGIILFFLWFSAFYTW
jgi:uncharacterized iron-regulated membrane protein